jgi:hypothetical protein
MRRLGPISSSPPSNSISLPVRRRLLIVLSFVAVVNDVATWVSGVVVVVLLSFMVSDLVRWWTSSCCQMAEVNEEQKTCGKLT